jgi:hypothetical protein
VDSSISQKGSIATRAAETKGGPRRASEFRPRPSRRAGPLSADCEPCASHSRRPVRRGDLSAPSRANSGVYVSRSVRRFLCVQGRGRSGQIGRCIGYQSGTTARGHNRARFVSRYDPGRMRGRAAPALSRTAAFRPKQVLRKPGRAPAFAHRERPSVPARRLASGA